MSKQAKLAGLDPVENNDTFSVRVRVGVQKIKNMKLIKVEDKIYEVKPCLHCKKDEVEYVEQDLPFNNEGWACNYCDSTYVIFNTEIAQDVTLREEREEKLKNIIKDQVD